METPVESGSETIPDPDAADIGRAQEGDGEAYGRVVRACQGEVARQMWRFTRDPAAHAELVQDVFVNAYFSLHGYRGTGPFRHWLRKIAVRTGMAHWKRLRRTRAEQPLDASLPARLAGDPNAHSPTEAGELVHLLLGRLPPRDRLVLTLLHLEERSVAEVAALTGWSPALVKVQAWRARAKMKRLMEKMR